MPIELEHANERLTRRTGLVPENRCRRILSNSLRKSIKHSSHPVLIVACQSHSPSRFIVNANSMRPKPGFGNPYLDAYSQNVVSCLDFHSVEE